MLNISFLTLGHNLKIEKYNSPNFGNRPPQSSIDMVVMHYTGMKNCKAALNRLCNPEANVSAHYVIAENGEIFSLVAEEYRAWHAGESFWKGATDINDRSIGIETVNTGHELGYKVFPEAQMAAVEYMLREIINRYQIPLNRVVGHSDIAPTRKRDPGELFDWQRLAKQGLSVWPKNSSKPASPLQLRELLSAIGYDPKAPLRDVIIAFQRRFVPLSVNGKADEITRKMIAGLAAIST